jgi:hypothetical protein
MAKKGSKIRATTRKYFGASAKSKKEEKQDNKMGDKYFPSISIFIVFSSIVGDIELLQINELTSNEGRSTKTVSPNIFALYRFP